jgi:hypothetical protein
MNDLLKKHRTSAPKVGASLVTRKPKVAVDALLTELSRPENGTIYDREYQTEHGNPYADSRFDAVPVKNDPKQAVGLSTSLVDGHERHRTPKDKNLLSESTRKEMELDEISDDEGFRATASSFDFEFDRNKRIARKVAANSMFKHIVTAANVKVDNDSLIVNIPRGKFAMAEFSLGDIAKMETELSAALHVRAKFAHTVLSSGFDGVSFEFMLV